MLANAANKLSENENYLAEYLLHLVNIILTSKGIFIFVQSCSKIY